MTKFTPYWWEGQPHYSESSRMPKNADVVIVGAGFTGLSEIGRASCRERV